MVCLACVHLWRARSTVADGWGARKGAMSLNAKVLIAEADRLVARAERHIEAYRQRIARLESRSVNSSDVRQLSHRAEQKLKRLHLYRAVLKSSSSTHALMPEH